MRWIVTCWILTIVAVIVAVIMAVRMAVRVIVRVIVLMGGIAALGIVTRVVVMVRFVVGTR